METQSVELETVLGVLGLECTDIPMTAKVCHNLYCNFGASPVAKLYFKKKGYTLRFGYDVQSKSIVDTLPSGGIRVRPTLNFRSAKL